MTADGETVIVTKMGSECGERMCIRGRPDKVKKRRHRNQDLRDSACDVCMPAQGSRSDTTYMRDDSRAFWFCDLRQAVIGIVGIGGYTASVSFDLGIEAEILCDGFRRFMGCLILMICFAASFVLLSLHTYTLSPRMRCEADSGNINPAFRPCQ